jgi:hypothetical protein
MNCLLTRFVLWLVTLALFPVPVNLYARSFEVEVLQRISLGALPQERALVETEQEGRTERVLAYLEQAEKKEIDPWLRDDLRIAWITAKWSQHGVPEWAWHRYSPAHSAATYQVLSCLPDEVWPRILAKRKSQLGSLYSAVYDENDLLREEGSSAGPLPPKKPARSEPGRIAAKKAA